MLINFSPARNGELTLLELSRDFTVSDLHTATNSYYGLIGSIIAEATDAELVYEPFDPDAYDPYAVTMEIKIGWNLAHLVLHVTASNEENAAISSLLARGIPVQNRLRYEPDWRTYTTRAQVMTRLQESREMCLAYLDTWPRQPQLNVYRDPSPRFTARFGFLNAPASYLLGLKHTDDHIEQFRKTLAQAQTAMQYATAIK